MPVKRKKTRALPDVTVDRTPYKEWPTAKIVTKAHGKEDSTVNIRPATDGGICISNPTKHTGLTVNYILSCTIPKEGLLTFYETLGDIIDEMEEHQ